MSCPKTQYLLTEYVAGDLPPLVSNEIESHLAVCQDCASETRICNFFTIIEHSLIKDRTHIILIGEEFGY